MVMVMVMVLMLMLMLMLMLLRVSRWQRRLLLLGKPWVNLVLRCAHCSLPGCRRHSRIDHSSRENSPTGRG